MEEIKIKNIKNSKLKFLLASGGAISGIILGFQLIVDSESGSHTLVKQILGFVSIVFWLAMITWVLKKFHKLQYGLILDEKGILNNSDEIKNIYVSWDKIEKVDLLGENEQSKMGVYLKELAEYKSTIKSKGQIDQIKRNINMYGACLLYTSDAADE